MRVTWEKRYITLGPVATVIGLAFHLYDPDGLIGDEEDVGITLALLAVLIPLLCLTPLHQSQLCQLSIKANQICMVHLAVSSVSKRARKILTLPGCFRPR